MAEQRMDVDTAHLRAGALRCGDAAVTALAAAGKLAEANPVAGVFGDFPEAHAFHRALLVAHRGHVDALRGHHRALTEIADKTHHATDAFVAQDASAADSVRATTAGFDGL
jgi:hypothetical protein